MFSQGKKVLFAAALIFISSCVPMNSIANTDSHAMTARPLADVLGVNHINSLYQVTDQEFLAEGADKILELGSRVIKVIIRDNLQPYYNLNMEWPEITNLVQAAELPYFRDLFSKPFSTIVLMTFRPGVPIHYFTEGMTPEDVQAEQEAYYEFTKYLLTKYKGTGKTFVLQNWEGDWVLAHPPMDLERHPDSVAIKGMIDWLNARQDGVDQARREVGMDGVRVFHAAEVNLVEKALLGYPTATNSVLPHTRCDLYSYSAYDTMSQGPEEFHKAMLYLKEKAPSSPYFGDNNVYIGEFGWPESLVPEETRIEMIRTTIQIALEHGAPYLVFWELYCDGLKEEFRTAEGPRQNEQFMGNWLIRPDGSKTPVWYYFKGLLDAEALARPPSASGNVVYPPSADVDPNQGSLSGPYNQLVPREVFR